MSLLVALRDKFTDQLTSNDISWDGESKRIIAVGEGKDKYVPWRRNR